MSSLLALSSPAILSHACPEQKPYLKEPPATRAEFSCLEPYEKTCVVRALQQPRPCRALSQSAVPATKSAHGGSQSAAPATKSAHGGSQSAAPATKSELQLLFKAFKPTKGTLTQALPHTSARRLQRLCCHVLRSSSSSPRPFQDCDNFCMALAMERRCVNSGVCCWRSPSFSHCPVHCPYHCLPHVLTVQLAFNLSLAPPFPLLLLSSPSFSCPVLTPSYILFRVATTVHAKGKVRANSFYIRGPGLEPTKSSDPSCFAIYKMACARVDRYRMMVPQDYYIMFTTIST